MNDRIFRHILLPAFAPVLFLVIATTPVDVLGCRTRGLLTYRRRASVCHCRAGISRCRGPGENEKRSGCQLVGHFRPDPRRTGRPAHPLRVSMPRDAQGRFYRTLYPAFFHPSTPSRRALAFG